MSSDAITILKDDHKNVKRLFRDFRRTSSSREKQSIARRAIKELTVHTYIENEVLYPQIRRLLPDLEDDVLEAYEEHHVADILCAELEKMNAEDERFNAKFIVLIESVTHHIGEEEDNWFPKVREYLSRTQLSEIGQQMQELRPSAPQAPSESASTDE
ncbi:MAG TPA: hemerythrin domain-containing protein [Actinomycetes bacterium]|nr:hemerythrin domain-containing protein [Actinomycetes bacterium]